MTSLRALVAAGLFCIPTLAAAQSSVVTVQNSSMWNIDYLYLSPSSSPYWGSDQLGSTIIRSGSAHTFMGIACDVYDVRLVDEDGDECVVNNISLCGEQGTWNITDADLLGCQASTAVANTPAPQASTYAPPAGNSVQMVNQSQAIIHELYVSPSASNAWGADQLGSQVIYPGNTFTLSGIACGTYDVMMTDPYGARCVISQVPLCAGSEQWVLTDQYLSACAAY